MGRLSFESLMFLLLAIAYIRERVLRRRAQAAVDRWEQHSLDRELRDTGDDDRRRLAEAEARAAAWKRNAEALEGEVDAVLHERTGTVHEGPTR